MANKQKLSVCGSLLIETTSRQRRDRAYFTVAMYGHASNIVLAQTINSFLFPPCCFTYYPLVLSLMFSND
jgi:hypothetical protein